MDDFTRWVIIDDTSPDIRYLDGAWFSDVGNWDLTGSLGMPYLSTLHGINSSGSFSVDFTGSVVAVLGSNLGSESPYWTCSVDGIAANTGVDTGAPACASLCNNYVLCYARGLDDGKHTLTVNATPNGNQTFLFDRIEYVPTPQASLEQKAIRVTAWDPTLVGQLTGIKRFTFYGVSVSWYGTIASPFNGSALNLSWSMDQSDANYTWDWRGNSNASYPLQYQKFFETPIYPVGEHTLTVMDSVGFDYLIVQNGTVPTRSSSGSYGSTIGHTVATPGTSSPGMSKAAENGAIAGGVIGGLLLFGIAFFVFLCRRRVKSQRNAEIHWDTLFFERKPAHSSLSPRPYPVQRKLRTLPIYPPDIAILPPSDPSQTRETKSTNESSITSGSTLHTETHGRQRQPMPPKTQPDVAVGVGQESIPGQSRIATRPTSGVRSNGQAMAAPVIHLPPEYTPT